MSIGKLDMDMLFEQRKKNLNEHEEDNNFSISSNNIDDEPYSYVM